MTPDEVQLIVDVGREHPNIEFKGPGSRIDKAFFSRVVRAVLALANTRDGGTVLIGVDEKQRAVRGLSAEELESWQSFDQVHADFNRYADPFVDIDVETVALNGATVIAITVKEFADLPVLCKQDGAEDEHKKKIVRRGACYVRGRTQGNQSIEVPTHVEMRALLELATGKKLRSFVTQANAVGLSTALPVVDHYAPEEAEVSGLVVAEVSSAPHWRIIVRPRDYVAKRVPFQRLKEIVREARVTTRYESFPDFESASPLIRGARYVGAEYDHVLAGESWRLFESGMFVCVKRSRAVDKDRLERSSTRAQAGISILEIITMYFHAFEFAARMAVTEAGADPMVVDVQAHGLRGRVLVEPDDWHSATRPSLDFDDWSQPQTIARDRLIGAVEELAVEQASEFFQRFSPGFAKDNVRLLVAMVTR